MHSTDQEAFWAGEFGDSYTERNKGLSQHTSNVFFWSKIIERTGFIRSCLEMGCNRGMNLDAIRQLLPSCSTTGIEINRTAAEESASNGHNVVIGSVLDDSLQAKLQTHKSQLTISCGVLIHINPECLSQAYKFLFDYSEEYILISEYYSPRPEEIVYRGHSDKLFKRDFAGEFLDAYKEDIKLVDYGFCWDRDPVAPKDNLNWFLFRKIS